MAYERVFDLKAKSFEMIDFVPVQSWAKADRIHDNRFDYLSSYQDHTRPAYPLAASAPPSQTCPRPPPRGYASLRTPTPLAGRAVAARQRREDDDGGGTRSHSHRQGCLRRS